MIEIMNTIPNVSHWSVQTNAVNLDKVPSEILSKFSAILASIDGRLEVNDENRGKGNYKKVLKNCKIARENGFKGDLIARMAVSEVADIYEEVTHLASINEPHFDHIHWQIDSQWDDDPKARWNNFEDWVINSYNPGIQRLVNWWLENMRKGKFIGLVPFIPVMKSILLNQPSVIRCGAGVDSFAINPNGAISVCPISPEFSFSIVGDIRSKTPALIKNSMFVSEPCPKCEIFEVCGGRCLFINKTKLWGNTLFDKVCSTVKNMVASLESIKDDVQDLISRKIISIADFDYPLYNNGCEIIP